MATFDESRARMQESILLHVHSLTHDAYQPLLSDTEENIDTQQYSKEEDSICGATTTLARACALPAYKKSAFLLICVLAFCSGALAGVLPSLHRDLGDFVLPICHTQLNPKHQMHEATLDLCNPSPITKPLASTTASLEAALDLPVQGVSCQTWSSLPAARVQASSRPRSPATTCQISAAHLAQTLPSVQRAMLQISGIGWCHLRG